MGFLSVSEFDKALLAANTKAAWRDISGQPESHEPSLERIDRTRAARQSPGAWPLLAPLGPRVSPPLSLHFDDQSIFILVRLGPHCF